MTEVDTDPKTVSVSAIWLRRIGDDVDVLAEIGGEWRLVIREWHDSNFSWISEARGWANKPLDDLPATEQRPPICGIVSLSGPHQEPLACGYPVGHAGPHAWAALTTWADTATDAGRRIGIARIAAEYVITTYRCNPGVVDTMFAASITQPIVDALDGETRRLGLYGNAAERIREIADGRDE